MKLKHFIGAIVASCSLTIMPIWAADSVSGPPLITGEDSVGEGAITEGPYISNWFHQSINVLGKSNVRYGPKPFDDIALEYDFFGRKGPVEIDGYVGLPKFFGIGTGDGIFDKGSPFYWKLKPRFSINEITGKDLSVGPFKEWFVAFEHNLSWGRNSESRSNVLLSGLGTTIDTSSPLRLKLNFYKRRAWENLGYGNEYSWDGYRAQMTYAYPLGKFSNGSSLSAVGWLDYDFGSKLRDRDGQSRTNTSLESVNALIYEYTHMQYFVVLRYYKNGGQWNDGETLNFGEGPFRVESTGFATYAGFGWKF